MSSLLRSAVRGARINGTRITGTRITGSRITALLCGALPATRRRQILPLSWRSQLSPLVSSPTALFSTSLPCKSEHAEETFEEFSDRFEKEFDKVQDVFELQRNLNNCFSYDLVPGPSVIVAALKAARRVNDFPTAVRIFEAIKNKVENRSQYDNYLNELKPLREELGVPLKEDMYPDDPKNWKRVS